MNQNKRIIGIDLLKAVSIFGVIFIHVRNGNVIAEYISELFRFAVPVFIVFFSYFLERSLSNVDTKEYWSVIKKKFFTLFFPYAFFTVLYFFILNDMSTIHISDLITGYWTGYGWPGQYFFIILFQVLILFPIMQSVVNIKKSSLVMLSFATSIFYVVTSYLLWAQPIVNMVSDRLFIYWIPYVLLGILLYKNLEYFQYFYRRGGIMLILLVLIPFEFTLFKQQNIIHSPYVLLTVLLASTMLSIYVVINNKTIESFLSEQIKRISVYISKHTLGIFVLNPLIILLLKPYVFQHQISNVFLESLWILTVALFILISSLILISLLEKTYLKKLVSN